MLWVILRQALKLRISENTVGGNYKEINREFKNYFVNTKGEIF